jgi:hypothetical protein
VAKLTFAVDHTTAGGANYKAGSTHDVADRGEASNLVHLGLARYADEPAGDTSAAAESKKK